MKEKLTLTVYVSDKEIKYSTNMPEILRKYFTSMETTIETMNHLTNNGEFNNITGITNEDNTMTFIFSGPDMQINVTSPIKKETLELKSNFSMLRNKIYHSLIKKYNVKYILKTKPLKLFTEHYKFYSDEKLIFELSFGVNTTLSDELSKFILMEKSLLKSNFSYKNVKKYEDIIENLNIIEFTDVYPAMKEVRELKEAIATETKVINNIVIEESNEQIENNLDEIDELMYQTGIISLSDIKEALENAKAEE